MRAGNCVVHSTPDCHHNCARFANTTSYHQQQYRHNHHRHRHCYHPVTTPRWDLVVIDPPSFAPNKAAVDKAKASYTRLFAAAAAVTAPHGVLCLASCSSHIDSAMFMEVGGVGAGCMHTARRTGRHAGTVLLGCCPAEASCVAPASWGCLTGMAVSATIPTCVRLRACRRVACTASVALGSGPLSSLLPSLNPAQICEEALGRARRQGYVLGVGGQPADHPFPAAADELRYLKFVSFRLEG